MLPYLLLAWCSIGVVYRRKAIWHTLDWSMNVQHSIDGEPLIVGLWSRLFLMALMCIILPVSCVAWPGWLARDLFSPKKEGDGQ